MCGGGGREKSVFFIFVLKKIWLGPCIFMAGMSLGALAGLSNLPLNFFEFGIATSVIAIGLLLLLQNQYTGKAILFLNTFPPRSALMRPASISAIAKSGS